MLRRLLALADSLVRFSGLPLPTWPPREDSPAAVSESCRDDPQRKKAKYWRAITRPPFDFFLSASCEPLLWKRRWLMTPPLLSCGSTS